VSSAPPRAGWDKGTAGGCSELGTDSRQVCDSGSEDIWSL